jgi:hypothetical protein
VRGLGCIAAGVDARAARVNAEIAARSHLVTARVLDAFGAVDWLDERDVFDFDYWPLELYKLQSAPSPRELSGHIAIVTGAASMLGRPVATRLARDGAHLVLSGDDTDALQQIAAAFPGAAHIAGDDSVADAIAAFGGVDIFVALNPVTSAELDRLGTVLQRQNMGGAVVGLEAANGETIDLRHVLGDRVRANVVRIEDGAEPALIAEVIAFLASSRAAATDRTTVSVGARLD